MWQKRTNEEEIAQLTEISHLQKYWIKIFWLSEHNHSYDFVFEPSDFSLKLIAFHSDMATSKTPFAQIFGSVSKFYMVSWLVDSKCQTFMKRFTPSQNCMDSYGWRP